MLKKLSFVLFVLLATGTLLTACAPAANPQPTTAMGEIANPIHPTTNPEATAVVIQPTPPVDIPQGADPCGETNGNGQVIAVGNNEFTMKRNNDGSDLVVHLSNGAMIQTSAGFISLSDLEIGRDVTLVGGPNLDGSFTADFVAVCNGS